MSTGLGFGAYIGLIVKLISCRVETFICCVRNTLAILTAQHSNLD